MTKASAAFGDTERKTPVAGMHERSFPERTGAMSDAPVHVVDLGAVDVAEDADPAEIGTQVPAAARTTRLKQQKEAMEGGQQMLHGAAVENAQGSAVADAVDLTQSPPPPFQPIVIEDTPAREARREEHEYVDLTASTPRSSGGELRRVTTIERDFELARRLQEEEEQAVQGTSQSSSSASGGSETVDDDLLLARRLQEAEDEGIARRLLQSARGRTSPPAVSAAYIHGILRAHQEGSDNDDNDNWSDGDGWQADELEAMQRMPFGRTTHTQAFLRGRYQPRVMARGRGRTGQQLPRDPHLRELMTREIDPNDYETLLQLDERQKNKDKHAGRQVELLIRNLPRYVWPDKTAPITGKGKRRVSEEKPANGKRRRREGSQPQGDAHEDGYDDRALQRSNSKRRQRLGSRQRPQSPSQDAKSAVLAIDDEAGESHEVARTSTAAASSSSSSAAAQPRQAEETREPEAEACPICLEQFSDGQVVCVTPCSSLHTFHETCIKHWLRVKAECPIDKTQLV